jgi:hypothetical protein
MKRSSTASCQRLVLTFVLVLMLIADIAQAQLPDCTSGTIMYATFVNDKAGECNYRGCRKPYRGQAVLDPQASPDNRYMVLWQFCVGC